MIYLMVGIGGAAGSILRYQLSAWCNPDVLGVDFPRGTFLANMLGCLCIGLFAHWATMEGRLSPEVKALLLTGFCGGFTTFSTFSLEGLAFIKNGAFGMYAAYTGASLVFGILAVLCGFFFGKML